MRERASAGSHRCSTTRDSIVPWVEVRKLASKVLALTARQVRVDFPRAYGIEPVLLKTFVEVGRFAGTCYRAANWVALGRNTGRCKCGRHHRATRPVKAGGKILSL